MTGPHQQLEARLDWVRFAMPDVLIGLDLGTSSCKAGVVSLDGIELGHGRVRTPWRRVPTGAELDPDDLLEAVARALDDALASVEGCRVVALGVASQAEAGFLVGGDERAVTPAIAWFDTRGDADLALLVQRLGELPFASTTGLPLTRLCSLAKYLWLRKHDERAAAGQRWHSLAEWVVLQLGGAPVSERSLASRTGFFDLGAGKPWQEALDAVGAPLGLVGNPVWAGLHGGYVTRPGWPIQGATLTVAGMDHPVAAIGAGITDGNTVLDSCGTVEAFVVGRRITPATDDFGSVVGMGATVGWHVIPDHLAYLAAVRSGAVLRRTLDLLGRSELEIEADAAGVDGVPRGPDRAFAIAGDDPATIVVPAGADPGIVWLEAIDRVTALGGDTLDHLLAAAQRSHTPVVAVGGWIRSAAARSAKAASLGASFSTAPVVEAGTRGAALLAGVAAGIYPSVSAVPVPAGAGLDAG